ncbi:Fpg/Nei family DNA glycosylase [Aestuariimicrobium ganziense]|uniref:Fpg/Nei family DNA glycosylase n=1 Tax=Aestuariimicrobium ganziense TaxID=2773677 RepID=UPI00194313EF|nr:DNA-formamidopyrimidine glycosylase family protein [Aestuariimicrobium ganziense]
MAEGHAVHRWAARVRELAGEVGRSTGRHTRHFDPALLDGLAVRDAEAHGKHLLVHLDGTEYAAHLHLGMDGAVTVRNLHASGERAPDRRSHYQQLSHRSYGLAWRLVTDHHVLDVTQPRICELLDPAGQQALHARLGPDPLRDDADPEVAVARLQSSDRPIADLLVDQSIISGIGNIYRAELLWRAELDPQAPGTSVDTPVLRRLWDDATLLLTVGLHSGTILTDVEQVRAARLQFARGAPMPRWQARYAVYARAGHPCRRCGATVEQQQVPGRQTLYWCPGCQTNP